MTEREIYEPHIMEAIDNVSYKFAMDKKMIYGYCLPFKLGIFEICKELINKNIVDPKSMYEFLNSISNKPAPYEWWKLHKSIFSDIY